MANRTPSDIAKDKIETQKILREAGYFKQVAKDASDAKAAQIAEDATNGRLADAARAVSDARHVAAMHDYETGSALAREIEKYRVKRTIADLAMSDGRRPNGETLPVVATVPPSAGLVKATETDAPNEQTAQ